MLSSFFEWVIDWVFTMFVEVLLLSVGHFVLGVFGIKPLRTRWLDITLATLIGLIVWGVVILGVGLVVGMFR